MSKRNNDFSLNISKFYQTKYLIKLYFSNHNVNDLNHNFTTKSIYYNFQSIFGDIQEILFDRNRTQ